MAQVSGRSGRKKKRGKVIIQTQQPDHWVIHEVIHHNYKNFFERGSVKQFSLQKKALDQILMNVIIWFEERIKEERKVKQQP